MGVKKNLKHLINRHRIGSPFNRDSTLGLKHLKIDTDPSAHTYLIQLQHLLYRYGIDL